MVNKMQKALIRKEIKTVVMTNRFFLDYLLLPLIMALILPVGLILAVTFLDNSAAEFEAIFAMMMIPVLPGYEEIQTIRLLINNFMPTFFLMIPPLTVTAVAAGSFTGEKERRTLETLLYSPMSLQEIFKAKVLVSMFVGMFVTVISFIVMWLTCGILIWVLLGEILLPNLIWLMVIGLVSPAFAFLGVIVQVRVSAKAKSSEDAFQRGGMLVLPMVLLIIGQFTGILMASSWLFATLGIILAVLAFVLMKIAFRKFTYEELLK